MSDNAEISTDVRPPPRLVAATFFGGPPLGYLVHLELGGLTVLLGPNGSGKSTALRGLTSNLLATLDDPENVSGAGSLNADLSLLFLELDDITLNDVLASAVEAVAATGGLAEAFPSGFPLPGWSTVELQVPPDWRDLPGAQAWLSVLRCSASELDGRDRDVLVAALARSKTIAVTPMAYGGRVAAFWALPAKIAREAEVKEALGRLRLATPTELDVAAGELDHLLLDAGPVALAPIGLVPTEPVPTVVPVPSREPDDVIAVLRYSIANMVTAARSIGEQELLDFVSADWREPPADGPLWLKHTADDSVTIHPAVWAVMTYAGNMIEERLPAFIAAEVGVDIEIEQIGTWSGAPNLSIALRSGVASDRDDETAKYRLPDAADGHRIWLELAILETARSLYESSRALQQAVADQAGADPVIENDLTDEPNSDLPEDEFEFYIELLAPFAVALETRPRIYVIDEPERHLHPAMERLAVSWLSDFATGRGTRVVIATHSPQFLRLTGDVVWNYADPKAIPAEDDDTGESLVTRIHAFKAHELHAFDLLATTMGFDRGELLAGVSLVLFVEGITDRDVLEELFGREFHSGGVAVLPIGGAAGADRKGIADAEILLRYTTARIAFLVDKASTPELDRLRESADERRRVIRSKSKRNTELKAMAAILQRAIELERPVVPVSIEVEDIFDLLDERVLHAHFRRFPGHHAARLRAAQNNRGWKTVYQESYSIDLVEKPDIFRTVAAEMRAGGRELEPRWIELRERILAIAAGEDPSPSRHRATG